MRIRNRRFARSLFCPPSPLENDKLWELLSCVQNEQTLLLLPPPTLFPVKQKVGRYDSWGLFSFLWQLFFSLPLFFLGQTHSHTHKIPVVFEGQTRQQKKKRVLNTRHETCLWAAEPNQQQTLSKLLTELRGRNFVTKHRLSIQVGAKRAKNVYGMCKYSDWASILHATVGGWVEQIDSVAAAATGFFCVYVQSVNSAPKNAKAIRNPLYVKNWGDERCQLAVFCRPKKIYAIHIIVSLFGK